MQVHAINIRNNNAAFGKIYKDANAKYSDRQELVIAGIKKTMRQPLSQFNGQTAEDYYKSKKNYDFIIEPDTSDTVVVKGYENMRYRGTGIHKRILADGVIHIGQYDSNNLLSIDDIKNRFKEVKRNDILYTANMLLIGLCMALIALNGPIMKALQKNKTPVEVIDSISNSVKSVLPDTTVINKGKNIKAVRLKTPA